MSAAVIQAIEPAARDVDESRVSPDMAETLHSFGDGLAGTISRPLGRAPRGTALVLLNAGLVHRMGPYRLHVQMARRLAAQGYVVLRFDQSGLGDSTLSPRVSDNRKRDELAAALDLVARETGVARFVLGGLCSGADDAFNFAPLEPRVVGLMLLDGVGYPTRGHQIRHYLPRLLSPLRVLRYLRRRLGKAPAGNVLAGNEDLRDFPSPAEATRRLLSLDERGVNTLLLYTGGVAYYYNHRRQARECFGKVMRSPRMATEYWPECDHTFYVRAHREKLFAKLADWMTSRFPD